MRPAMTNRVVSRALVARGMQNRVVLASVERRAAYMGVEALRDEVARLKALLGEARGYIKRAPFDLIKRIDAALAPTDADRRGEDGEAVDAAGGGV